MKLTQRETNYLKDTLHRALDELEYTSNVHDGITSDLSQDIRNILDILDQDREEEVVEELRFE